ncbi:hypothetical protein ACTXT7_011764 [Hymenolepis weldensis]
MYDSVREMQVLEKFTHSCTSRSLHQTPEQQFVISGNLPGVYILGLVPDSEADLDGRLNKDDRILEINGVDLREGTQEEAANIIRNYVVGLPGIQALFTPDILAASLEETKGCLIGGTYSTAEEHVALVVTRVIRPHTPEMLRSGSGEIFMDFGGGGNGGSSTTSTSAATRSPGTAVPPPATTACVLPSSLKSPSTRLCREQVLGAISSFLNESDVRRRWKIDHHKPKDDLPTGRLPCPIDECYKN